MHVCVHVRYLCFGVPNLSLALVRVANCKGEGAATSTTRAGAGGARRRARAACAERGAHSPGGAAPPYLCVLTNAISYHSPKRVCMTSNRVNLTEHGSLVVQFLWYTKMGVGAQVAQRGASLDSLSHRGTVVISQVSGITKAL